jgi:Ca-activated chloride channel homolog
MSPTLHIHPARIIPCVVYTLFLFCLPSASHCQLQLFIDEFDASKFPEIRAKVRVLRNNVFVRGLTIANFTILEDNVVQAPIAGYCEDTVQSTPISVMLIIDRSGSMDGNNALGNAKTAAKNFVDRLTLNDECALISFSTVASYDQSWTSNKTLMKNAISSLAATGGTALWDAVYTATFYIKSRTKRKAIVLLTDGDDNQSQRSYNEALAAVKSAGAVVYAIGLGSSLTPARLKDMSTSTGGKYYSATTSTDLDEIYRLISQEIATSGLCELRYSSKLDCMDGSTHTVRITVNTGGESEYAEAQFTLPYNPTTFSYVTLSMGTDYVVNQGASITVPLELARVSTNRPPRSFQFDVDYDRRLLTLDSATTTDLTKNYTVTHQPTASGSTIVLRGTQPITATGVLVKCHFSAAQMERSTKARIVVTPPDVQQFCTEATSNSGLITISGSCERAVARSTATLFQTRLLPNVPNPFNPTTRIRYTVGTPERVTLTMYDAVGRAVRTLVHEEQKAGEYDLMFDATELANGAYFLRLTVGRDTDVRQILLLK